MSIAESKTPFLPYSTVKTLQKHLAHSRVTAAMKVIRLHQKVKMASQLQTRSQWVRKATTEYWSPALRSKKLSTTESKTQREFTADAKTVYPDGCQKQKVNGKV